ncbi:NhaP-type Na+/H+ or K+/H+ antiporter [Vibrio xiamenensis]|uniref:NhaP-type Na+/H+ or K+/H+ antiporter n=1 Tax=Vibrio xiamenensis TaxID=861298 RepID=A0A1G7ZDS2_9VIBR|nr:sodium:proton antiporter [Vibrio xiamenensis]SDH06765.1 NhaP-type Na+/H+ or K+/H+ antiporter [Vibrio xiamenensis]
MELSIAASLALIGLLSLLCQLIGWRLHLPAILPLLLVGLTVGPGFDIIDPDALFGDTLFPLISLGVAIILFEGALTLNIQEIRGHGRMVMNLVTVGIVVTWTCVTLGAHFLAGFDWALAALFSALVVVTGPTVIAPMLKSVHPKAELGRILRWEGIIIDPIGALLAVLVYEFIVSSAEATEHMFSALAMVIGVGLGLGIIAGIVVAEVLKRNWVPHYLRNITVLTIVLGVYALSNELQEESGLLTVTILGMWLANIKNLELDDIIEFKETLTVLLISGLFILLASRLDSNAFTELGWGGVGVLGVVMFIARPLSVWLSGIGTDLTAKDKWFLSWIAPRGIVAAAVSSLFAIKLDDMGLFEGIDKLVPLVFLMIIGTVVAQSLTARLWAKFLGITQGKPQGVLIFGATSFTREFAKVLAKHKIKTILSDTNWESIRLSRMENLNVYFGNPASSHAESHLDMSGIGKVMVASPYRQTNPIVSMYYQNDFGENSVYQLSVGENTHERYKVDRNPNEVLFGDGVSYAKLNSLMATGSTIKSTPLTESFGVEQFWQRNPKALPLCLVKEGRLWLLTANEILEELETEGWELISVIPPDTEQQELVA